MKNRLPIFVFVTFLLINTFILAQSSNPASGTTKAYPKTSVANSNIRISIAGKKQVLPATKFTKQELLSFNSDLIALSDTSLKVVRFDLYTNLNGFDVTESTDSNSLSDKMKVMITRMKAGGKGYIRNVHCKYPNGAIRETDSYSFQVIQ